MSRTNLPSSIERYFEGTNAHDADRASSLFAEDAVVHDEGSDHVGRPAIRAWVQDTSDRYATKLVVESVSESSDATMVVARMSGTFPGSPAKARFLFQLADGLITHLDIKP
jgi:ketosteroid isomerase-like protein